MKDPTVDQVYRHQKGGEYIVISLAEHTDTEECLVVYRRRSDGAIFARPREAFMGDRDGKPRFELLGSANDTTADERPVEIDPETAKVLRNNMLLFRGQVSDSGKKKIDIVVQGLTEALAVAGHLGDVEPDDDLSVPELFVALRDGINVFEEYLSSHGVEYRRVNVGPQRERDGVRFAVDDEHWTADFYDNGIFKQLAWT